MRLSSINSEPLNLASDDTVEPPIDDGASWTDGSYASSTFSEDSTSEETELAPDFPTDDEDLMDDTDVRASESGQNSPLQPASSHTFSLEMASPIGEGLTHPQGFPESFVRGT